jgi:hypothetical protein
MSRYTIKPATFEDFDWLAKKTGCTLTTDFNAIKAIDATGKIHGMVGYCDWTQNSVRMHIAVESPIAWRAMLRPGLEYPFCQVGVGMIVGVIRGGNAKSLRFAGAVGLKEIFRLKDGARAGEDIVFMQLLKEDCRYLLGNESHWAPEHRRAA